MNPRGVSFAKLLELAKQEGVQLSIDFDNLTRKNLEDLACGRFDFPDYFERVSPDRSNPIRMRGEKDDADSEYFVSNDMLVGTEVIAQKRLEGMALSNWVYKKLGKHDEFADDVLRSSLSLSGLAIKDADKDANQDKTTRASDFSQQQLYRKEMHGDSLAFYQKLKNSYSQTMNNLFSNCMLKTLSHISQNFISVNPTLFSVNVYCDDQGKIRLKSIQSQFKASYTNENGEFDGTIIIPGTLAFEYVLTPKGFQLDWMSFSNNLIKDLCLKHEIDNLEKRIQQASKDEAVNSLAYLVSSLTESLQKKYADKKAAIAIKEEELQTLDNEQKNKEAEISDREVQLDNKEAELDEETRRQASKAKELRGQVELSKKKLTQCHDTISAQQTEIGRVKNQNTHLSETVTTLSNLIQQSKSAAAAKFSVRYPNLDLFLKSEGIIILATAILIMLCCVPIVGPVLSFGLGSMMVGAAGFLGATALIGGASFITLASIATALVGGLTALTLAAVAAVKAIQLSRSASNSDKEMASTEKNPLTYATLIPQLSTSTTDFRRKKSTTQKTALATTGDQGLGRIDENPSVTLHNDSAVCFSASEAVQDSKAGLPRPSVSL